jgi:hypothetical protein
MQPLLRKAVKPVSEHDRASARYKIFELVSFMFDGHETRAHLLNISMTGALVHSAQPPKTGSAIQLVINGRHYPARVVWSHGARFGIAFGRHLSALIVESILR